MPEEFGMPPPPKKEGTGMFKHKAPVAPDFSEVKGEMNNLERRLKVLEEAFTNIRKGLQVAEQNMLSKNKTSSTDIKTLTSDINEIRKEMLDMKEKILMIVKDLEGAAKINEVKVLEKYINLWNPVKFVTQNEVERIIDEKIKDQKKPQG
ncbi:hypothetical protein ISS05_00730 [Candidatus Woesearchaeota archaeon]|nr:hypothetical protein [Candidatus Woesearchaeota archaeon]